MSPRSPRTSRQHSGKAAAAVTVVPPITTLPCHTFDAVVVGSGAAGLACACRIVRELERAGVSNPAGRVALVTRGLGLGTSNLAGSDKQTYYKLGAGGEPDTPRELAATLIAGGCMHGDVALAEATASLRAFHQLVELGVPFPHDAWGAFVGYKTDHDPRRRATSAGPWTSRFMVAGWLAELRRLGVRVFNRHHLLAVVTGREDARAHEGLLASPTATAPCGPAGARASRSHCVRSPLAPAAGPRLESNAIGAKTARPVARGILCADLRRQGDPDGGLVLFRAGSVVVAGGGPGELFERSVFPRGQMGPYAALLEAGAEAHNLTELQFGMASLRPRWNLSGTYQQVVPRYFSTDARGGDEREFLNEHFPTMGTLATAIFLKGYQWPFDPDKAFDGGSSLIDVLVHEETVRRGRRVFLDFRENPRATGRLRPFALRDLSPEAHAYLERSGATQPTPIERLECMNPPSVALYREKGVDLASEPLEIGICAQHCNGGFAVDAWWETTVGHLFAIGETAGTHGVKRPGGSALNAGQVGALRAAQRIVHVHLARLPRVASGTAQESRTGILPVSGTSPPQESRTGILPVAGTSSPQESRTGILPVLGAPELGLEATASAKETGRMPVLLSPPVLPSPPALLSPPFDPHAFLADANPLLERFTDWMRVLRRAAPPRDPNDAPVPTAAELRRAIQCRMSTAAGILRSGEGVERVLAEAGEEWRALEKRSWHTSGKAGARAVTWLPAWELRELALAQRAFLEALRDFIAHGGGSRGSFFVTSSKGRRPLEALDADWAALAENKALREVILGVRYDARRDRFVTTETPVRPMPVAEDPWFETVWADFREGRVFGR